MSRLVVEVCRIEDVRPHPNPAATRMLQATVKGWCSSIKRDPATGKAQFKVGDACIYIPQDAVILPALAKRLGIEKYLAPLPKNPDGSQPSGLRVRAARLQGCPSYGVVMEIDPAFGDDPNWPVGTDVAKHFGITKWEPPPCTDFDAGPHHPLFHRFTEIQHWGNYPTAFAVGEMGIITEKLHGKCHRQGYVRTGDDVMTAAWEFTVGSHDTPRVEIGTDGIRSPFWDAVSAETKALLAYVRDELEWPEHKFSVLLFGEQTGTQDMKYGLSPGVRGYRLFNIAVNGVYLDNELVSLLCRRFNVEMVPELYRGPITPEIVELYTNGPTTMCAPQAAGKFKGREGIVVTPLKERFSPVLSGRLVLKSVSVDYLARKGGTDSH